MSRWATAVLIDKAVCRNDNAASFFSLPVRLPNSPSTPLTIEGTKPRVCRSTATKFIYIPLRISCLSEYQNATIHPLRLRNLPGNTVQDDFSDVHDQSEQGAENQSTNCSRYSRGDR